MGLFPVVLSFFAEGLLIFLFFTLSAKANPKLIQAIKNKNAVELHRELWADSRGPEVAANSKHGEWSLLRWSLIRFRDFEITKTLIDAGAKTHDPENDPFGEAETSFIYLFGKHGPGDNRPIHELLLNAPDVKIDHADSSGNTALMRAASSGDLYFLNLLLSKGAQVNIVNRNRKSALEHAVMYGGYSVLETAYPLIGYGAVFNENLIFRIHRKGSDFRKLAEDMIEILAVRKNQAAFAQAIHNTINTSPGSPFPVPLTNLIEQYLSGMSTSSIELMTNMRTEPVLFEEKDSKNFDEKS